MKMVVYATSNQPIKMLEKGIKQASRDESNNQSLLQTEAHGTYMIHDIEVVATPCIEF